LEWYRFWARCNGPSLKLSHTFRVTSTIYFENGGTLQQSNGKTDAILHVTQALAPAR
jgi:hypothetical protein